MEHKTLEEAIEDFLVYQSSIRGLSDNSVVGYRNDLAKLAESLGKDAALSVITPQDLRHSIAALSRDKYAPASINRYISAVRVLFAYCRRFEYIGQNPAEEIKTMKQPKTLPAFMTQSEVDALCAEPERAELLWASRDKALFETLYSSGCRVSELASLAMSDLAEDCRSAIVRGKGNKERKVFFADDAADALHAYLSERKLRIMAEKPVAEVFVNQKGTGLTSRGIRYVVARYSGVEGTRRHVSPHAFRHTFATAMLSGGADVRIVQELLGHTSVSTTQRYTHISREHLMKVYQKAHPHGGLHDD
ncbi:tyrosine-type recombinase/integrase [Treponema endosymbiont of Eucomonympha sp.]|uniref:tyrosine-type recombinase/integrase n=1 Tax=Treponema endosymbiont of Eucomonympha sp. TaxID=1580831 RepID=UPI00075160B0|nr:tyrosine-type recombinase/integrase [Treponema endosymbiont of Eucomonympha sp.]